MRRSVVTDRVAWSVGLSVFHSCEPCKMAEPIEMPFGLWTQVGPMNDVLDGVQMTQREGVMSGPLQSIGFRGIG